MRYCVNPECPYQAKFRRPAEYQDAATTCSDCGAALGEVTAAAVVSAPAVAPAAPWPAELWRRVLVTAALLAAVVAGNMLPLPGLYRGAVSPGRGLGMMTVLSVGAQPFLWSMLLVEIVAALVPAWRPLREGGEGRRRLWRVALGIGLVFAVVQSVAPIRSLESAGLIDTGSITGGAAWPPQVLMLILFAGSLFTLLVVRVANLGGLSAGFALVVLGSGAGDLWRWVQRLQWLSAQEISPLPGIAFLAAWTVGLIWVFRRAGGSAGPVTSSAERPRGLPFPVAGAIPIMVGTVLIYSVLQTAEGWIPALHGTMNFLLRWTRLLAAVKAVIAVNAMIALGLWFHGPAGVAAAWARWTSETGAAADLQRAQVRSRVRALLPTALAWNGAMVAAWIVPELVGLEASAEAFNLATLAAGVAIALDLVEEVQSRSAGELAVAWTLIRPYEVEPALEALRAAGIQARVRGLHARAIYQFFGPLLPIDVLVPPGQVDQARAVLGGGP